MSRRFRRPGGVHARRAESGFSLIEVLVAILILGVGVLGVAGLQLLSLQNNTSAMYRTQAVQSAYDIIDRARANRAEAYNIAIDDDAPTASNCVTSTCSRTEMRNFDLAAWRAALETTLPEGTGGIETSGGVVTVTVRWQDTRDPNAELLDIAISTGI